MGKKEINMNFKADEDFKNFVGDLLIELGCTFADLARTSILLASDQIKKRPILLKIVDLEPDRNQENNGK
jgi:hypothetical protein